MKIEDVIYNRNGSIHIQPGRYGGGWICLVALDEYDIETVFESFWDLTAGDNEYFQARDSFRAKENCILVEYAESPEDALRIALREALAIFEKENRE